jgi:hypothetical protein
MTTMTGKRSTISKRLESLLVRRILEESVEDHKAFGRSLDEFNAYVLQTEKEDHDGERVRRLLEGLAPTFGRHFETEPLSFYKLKHLTQVG